MRKPELDAPSLQSKEIDLQTSLEVWVDNNNKGCERKMAQSEVIEVREGWWEIDVMCDREVNEIYIREVKQREVI